MVTSNGNLSNNFEERAKKPSKRANSRSGGSPAARTRMLSLRLTAPERSRLEADAGGIPMGEYIRGRLFGGRTQASRSRLAAPDRRLLAQALAKLGQLKIGPDLSELARAASVGALTVTPELEAALGKTAADVSEIKALLMAALDVRES